MENKEFFRTVCQIYMNFSIHRYLMVNSEGRLDGTEKAHLHIKMCEFYTAIAFSYHSPDNVRFSKDGAEELFNKIHSATQEGLTDRMDKAIGFPITGRPDYNKLAPLFFNIWHEIAIGVIMHH